MHVTAEQLYPKYVDKLASSGLTIEDAEKLGYELMDGPTAVMKLGLRQPTGGFKIPYRNLDGTDAGFWRFRFLESTKTGFMAQTVKKEIRYVQAAGSLNKIYVPGLVDWAKVAENTTIPIVITEGELKAACGCKNNIPTIGLGGVWCFKSSAMHMNILPQFGEIKWQNRAVYIAYDSDAATNDKVIAAENALAKELVAQGARVHILRLPQLVPPEKTGLDDYIVYEGKKSFMMLTGTAIEWGGVRELFGLNEEVVYVRDPGMILKISSRQPLSAQAFTQHAYSTRRYFEEQVDSKGKVKLIERSAPVEWLKWPGRAEVEKTTYAPGEDRITAEGELNMWRGWGCSPSQGSIEPWEELMNYVFKDDKEARVWFERWLAYPLQNPGTKMFTAAVVWGTYHGTGKSLIGYTMGKIYGENFSEIENTELDGNFNAWAENRQFVMGEEITGGDKRGVADRIKAMITQRVLRINQKFLPVRFVPDVLNYYFTSNHPDSFYIEDTDRRLFIHELSGPPKSRAFYARYEAWMNNTGPAHLFHYLLNLDLGDFAPQAPAPMTISKLAMIEQGRSDIGGWVAMLKAAPEAVLKLGEANVNFTLMTSKELQAVYEHYSNSNKVTANGVARELSRANFPKAYRGMPLPTEHGPQRLWIIKDHERVSALSGPELSALYHKERGIQCKRTSKF